MMQKLFIFLVNTFYLFFATSGMGVMMGDRFVLSLPVICLILMDVVLIIMLINKQTNVRGKPFIFASFFIVWAILVTITRYGISTFILSILGLMIMWIPLVIKIPLSDKLTFLTLSKSYCRGLIFSFLWAYQDLFSALFSLPKTEEIIPFAVVQGTGDLSNLLNISFDRINSLMTEPSEYATFLVFGYICLDYLENQKSIGSKKLIILRLHIFIFLLLTFSLTGFLLFISYLILNVIFNTLSMNYLNSVKMVVRTFLAIASIFFISVNTLPGLQIAVLNSMERIESLQSSSGNLNTSEGSRFNSMNLAFDSLSGDYGLIGQGFGKNTSNWISENYGNKGTQYYNGNIFNIYAAVTIAVGLPGLLFFIGIIYQAFINSESEDKGNYKIICLFVWLISGFCFGSLLWYSVWGFLYLVTTQGAFIKSRTYNAIKL